MALLLGCVADDLTGATDLALMLKRAGLSVTQVIGVPESAEQVPEDEAVVVSLKSRTTKAAEAVAESVRSLRSLKEAGAQQFLFKYCSTFDSTSEGNIGPVTDALMTELGETFTIACPAFPANGRTVYLGHLFVHGALLEQSSLRTHPLTPMTDSNLMRVLEPQTKQRVGLISYPQVTRGVESILTAFERCRQEGVNIAVIDALDDTHVENIGHACEGVRLVTGGSAVATGLAHNFLKTGAARGTASSRAFVAPPGKSLLLAGSCSQATLAQIAHAEQHMPTLRLDVPGLLAGKPVVAEVLAWAQAKLKQGPALIYSSDAPSATQQLEQTYGREQAGSAVEQALATIAEQSRAEGVRRFVVAGGETSGAVVKQLGVQALSIGPEIDPGVPWTISVGGGQEAVALALKSGNFGGEDFFVKALGFLS